MMKGKLEKCQLLNSISDQLLNNRILQNIIIELVVKLNNINEKEMNMKNVQVTKLIQREKNYPCTKLHERRMLLNALF